MEDVVVGTQWELRLVLPQRLALTAALKPARMC